MNPRYSYGILHIDGATFRARHHYYFSKAAY